jgi:hypothetical protein
MLIYDELLVVESTGLHLRNGTKRLDVKFVRCYNKLFLGGGSYENPRENQVSGTCFWSPTAS